MIPLIAVLKKILAMFTCNYNHLQPNILMNFFKTNCCYAYSSHLWKFYFNGFDKY